MNEQNNKSQNLGYIIQLFGCYQWRIRVYQKTYKRSLAPKANNTRNNVLSTFSTFS